MNDVRTTPALRHLRALLALLGTMLAVLAVLPADSRADACTPPVTSVIACENLKPGADPDTWEIEGFGDPTIQGFATNMSVNKGETVSFKINAPSNNYRVDILRIGYYNGDGARVVKANLAPTGQSVQPNCLTDSNTGLIDCGNWGVSLSWAVPSDAVSGVYMAHLVRNDTGGDSHIMFVVRDDTRNSDIVVQTNDSTWQAYNSYGGNSLYVCTVDCPPGNPLAYKAAYKVSYNRPLDTEAYNPRSAFFQGGEYPMVRFLERNGYDVSYMAGVDVHRRPASLLTHKMFMSSGHDEYWSMSQRTAMENARAAGVNLTFFSGNEGFWKTRWEPSAAGPTTPDRTLVSYKDTHFNGRQDPVSWTGTWRDPRYTSPSENIPENALTGQSFVVNDGTTEIEVPSQFKSLRFWRNTDVEDLGSGQKVKLGTATLGYEWDEDVDNGYRPAGSFRLSHTVADGLEVFTDYGSATKLNGTAQHNMTLYRAPSGALVFGAGTVQWAWGLDDGNVYDFPADRNMQQATVNLFADMGLQPATLIPGIIAATKSTDTTKPTATVTSPPSSVNDGATVTLTGTAADAGGGVVAGVEVSTDGGSTWHLANGTSTWTYSWKAHGHPTASIRVRATDDSGNLGAASAGVNIAVSCPCSFWGTSYTPTNILTNDTLPIEVGLKFKTDVYGAISGVRFWKASVNTGTHTGSLWTSTGERLAQATFQNESSSGWQTVTFTEPVVVEPGVTYIASYHAPNGGYAATADYFHRDPAPGPNGGGLADASPLHAIRNTNGNTNGVFLYTGVSAFPTQTFAGANYWVDVIYSPIPAAGAATGATAVAGRASATVDWNAPSNGGAPTKYEITPFIGASAQTTRVVTGTPPATDMLVKGLTPGATYTFTVRACNPNGCGPVSPATGPVTILAPIAPTAPTGVSAEPASQKARISWTAPTSDGGSDITGYTVTPYVGASAQTPVTVGADQTSVTIESLSNGTAYTFRVAANNAIGSTQSAASTAVTPQNMMFDLLTPTRVDSGDGGAVELGMKFKSDVYGTVTGVRFYKSALNTGTHTGSVWSASGALLARATFQNESPTGWQSVTFSEPVEITANTTYVVSYHAPKGRYSVTTGEFDSAIDSSPLHAISNAQSPNGLYSYTGTPEFPQFSFASANYWVDVMFQPTPPPGQVTGVTAVADRASASVTWTAPATGGKVTSYQVTPYLGTTAQTTKTVTGSPLPTTTTVTGLTPGQNYTFRVRAVNPNGSGALSGSSNTVTPLAPIAPAAPGDLFVVPATGAVQLNWTQGYDGGSPITGFTVTPYIDGVAQPVTNVDADKRTLTLNGLTNGANYTFKVTATNAAGSTQSAASRLVVPQPTLFDLTAPANPDAGDGSALELGVKFKADVDGYVNGVRFYKSAANIGTHVGSLWASNGLLLGRATFTNESPSGWQSVTFDPPVEVTAGTTYTASYHAPNGHYAASGAVFNSPVTNPPLRALVNASDPNGVYGYSSVPTRPNNDWNATNYWVDVMFLPTPPPGQVTGVSATGGNASATISWTAPTTGASPTSYEVTPYIGATAQTPKVVTGSPLATTTKVNGLTPGTAYTFRVRAGSANGYGPQSAASNSVTPTGQSAPTAPTNLFATPATNAVRVTWSEPASDGGSDITGYTVTPYIGATAQTPVNVGPTVRSATINSLTNGTDYTFRVTATNVNGSTQSTASAAVTPRRTLLDFSTPDRIDGNDPDPIELGVKFRASVDGTVTGVRFYKAPTNTGTHVGTLWQLNGQQLARATFTNESASGWQSVTFASPVGITAGTTYVVSYHAPNGHYSYNGQAFASPLTNGPLEALADSVSGNGVYGSGGTPNFPNNSFNAANYWVDVLFAPTGE